MGNDLESDGVNTLDVREIDGEPFGDVMAALDELGGDETLVLIADFEPVPLYGVLKSKGYDHETEQVSDDEYHVHVTHARGPQ